MIIDYKKYIGESMQSVIDRFKKEYKLDKNEKIAFAGRLDPIAFGIVRLLSGENRMQMDNMCLHDKIYSFDVIEGFTTDTYDILGLINNMCEYKEMIFDTEKVIQQEYPIYSSKTVDINGRMVRLWDAAKNNMLENIKIPTKEVKIYYVKKLGCDEFNSEELYNIIENIINTVKGDFRQKEILENWKEVLLNKLNKVDKLNKIKINHYITKISSGGYVRSIAHNMGGVAMNICRMKYLD
jgi:tRNA U55 pseudouridine synthase TruB